jgi:hypothetical protein
MDRPRPAPDGPADWSPSRRNGSNSSGAERDRAAHCGRVCPGQRRDLGAGRPDQPAAHAGRQRGLRDVPQRGHHPVPGGRARRGGRTHPGHQPGIPRTQVYPGGQYFTVVGVLRPVPLAPQIDEAALVGFPVANARLGLGGHDTEIYLRAQPDQVQAVAQVSAAASPWPPLWASWRASTRRRGRPGCHRPKRCVPRSSAMRSGFGWPGSASGGPASGGPASGGLTGGGPASAGGWRRGRVAPDGGQPGSGVCGWPAAAPWSRPARPRPRPARRPRSR